MTNALKKTLALLVGSMLVFGLTSCGSSNEATKTEDAAKTEAPSDAKADDAGDKAESEEKSDDKAAEPTEINLMVPSYSDHTKELWEEIIAKYEKAYDGAKVNLDVQSWENINDVIRTKIQSNAAPDILNIDSFTDFASDDLLYPAKDVVSEDVLNNIPQSFRDNASMDGEQWGLPLIASARAMYYNKDLFKEAGIENAPKTWDELAAAAKKITDLKKEGVSGYGMPLGKEEAQAETAIWFFGGGGGYTDGKNITIDTPANVESAKFMKKLIDEKLTQANPGATQRTPLGETFFQGKVGMVIGLPPYINMIKEQNPDLNYGLAPIPTKDGKPMTLGVADHLMAFKNDGSKQAAIKQFLDFFYQDDQYVKFVETEGFIPVTITGGEKLKDNPTIKDFIPLLPDAKFYPFTNPKWQTAQGAIQSTIGKIESTDPAEVLKEIQEKTDDN